MPVGRKNPLGLWCPCATLSDMTGPPMGVVSKRIANERPGMEWDAELPEHRGREAGAAYDSPHGLVITDTRRDGRRRTRKTVAPLCGVPRVRIPPSPSAHKPLI